MRRSTAITLRPFRRYYLYSSPTVEHQHLPPRALSTTPPRLPWLDRDRRAWQGRRRLIKPRLVEIGAAVSTAAPGTVSEVHIPVASSVLMDSHRTDYAMIRDPLGPTR